MSGGSPLAPTSNIPNEAHDPDGDAAFAFKDLDHAPLIVDAVDSGGNQGHRADVPIQGVTGTGNAGGFRHRNKLERTAKAYGALGRSGADPTGQFCWTTQPVRSPTTGTRSRQVRRCT